MCACYGAFQGEQEAGAGDLPPLHGKDELVTWPWPDCPAPGREPGCPEMSSGSLGDPFSFLCLWFGLGAKDSLPLRSILTMGPPPVAPRVGHSLG